MKLTAKLAYSQIKNNRSRSIWTLVGIALSSSMITAVFGFAASGNAMITRLMGDNEFYTSMYNSTIYVMAAVFVLIIISASVIVVSNSFRVSAGERTMQFGILKSVGTTKKQITEIIIYESLYLCLIGIPIGVALGLIINITGVEIANFLLIVVNNLSQNNILELSFVFSWQAILLSLMVSLLTVLLSAWLPARKAAKIPAIDAIRGRGEIKVKAKRYRKSRIIGKIFGFEGTLASKSLSRSKRSFRATVISLAVSVTMLIVAGAFAASMSKMTEGFYPGIDVTVAAQFITNVHEYHYSENNVVTEYATIPSDELDRITGLLREYSSGTPVYGSGMDYLSSQVLLPKSMMTQKMLERYVEYFNGESEFPLPIAFVTVDAVNYAYLCDIAGVPVGSNILLNRYVHYQEGGREIFAPYVFEGQTLRVVSRYDDSVGFELPLHGVLSMEQIPSEILYGSTGQVMVLVPYAEVTEYFWFAKPSDKEGFIKYAEEVLSGVAVLGHDSSAIFNVMDVEEAVEAMLSVSRLIMTFVYGFVGLLTLIGLTNVISTISANIRSRSREFAILRSVGMTSGGITRMINLESILCSAKSLVIGIPLGIAGSYLIYLAMVSPVESSFAMPWLPIVQCALGVFVLTWAVMRYSASRLHDRNIIETIRTDSMM